LYPEYDSLSSSDMQRVTEPELMGDQAQAEAYAAADFAEAHSRIVDVTSVSVLPHAIRVVRSRVWMAQEP